MAYDLARLGAFPPIKLSHDPTKTLEQDPSDLMKTGVNGLFNSLESLNELLKKLMIEAITGLVEGGLPDLARYFTNWESTWGGIDWNAEDFNPQAAIESFINDVLLPTGLFAEAAEAVQAFIDYVLPGWLPQVPLSSITDINPNLLWNDSFSSAESIAEGDFVHDATRGRTSNGSAKITFDGLDHSLFSNPVLAVEGDEFEIGVFGTWENVTTSGGCLQLIAHAYNAANQIVGSFVGTPIGANGTQAAWQTVTAAVDVIAPADTAYVALELKALAAATAGDGWFDDAYVRKTNLLTLEWVDGLRDELDARIAEVQAIYNEFKGAVGGTLADITSRIQYLIPSSGWFDSSKLTNIAGIPTIPGENVAGIEGTVVDDLNTHVKDMVQQFWGQSELPESSTLADAQAAMANIWQTILLASRGLQQLISKDEQAQFQGSAVNVNFKDYANGALPGIFEVTYSGAGSSVLTVKDGVAGYNTLVADGNRTAFVRYSVAPLQTDFMVIRGTMNSPPAQGSGSSNTPKLWAVGRCSADRQNYIWARGYCDGFLSYKGEVGCTVAGVEYVWGSNIPLTWSMDIYLKCGVGTVARAYQVFSGGTLVFEYSEPAALSMLGANYRYWGCVSEMKTISGKAKSPGDLVGSSAYDNTIPTVAGTAARVYRYATASAALSTGYLPSNFFDSVSWQSLNITPNLGIGGFTVANGGLYRLGLRIRHSGTSLNYITYNVYINGVLDQWGRATYLNVNASTAEFVVNLKDGDTVRVGLNYTGGSIDSVGDTSGTETWMNIAKVS